MSCKIDPNNPGAKKECHCFIEKFFKWLFGCKKKDGCCKTDDKAEGHSCCCGHKHDEKK